MAVCPNTQYFASIWAFARLPPDNTFQDCTIQLCAGVDRCSIASKLIESNVWPPEYSSMSFNFTTSAGETQVDTSYILDCPGPVDTTRPPFIRAEAFVDDWVCSPKGVS